MISSPRLQAVSTMLCTELVVPPTIEKRVGSAERIGGQFLRFADDGYRMAEIIQRLHAVHIHPNALLGPKRRSVPGCRVPAYDRAHQREPRASGGNFPALRGWGRGAGPTGRVFSSPFMFTSVRGSFGKCRLAKQKIASLTRVCRLAFETSFFSILPQAKSPRACLPGERMRHDSKMVERVRVYIAILLLLLFIDRFTSLRS